MEYKIGDKKVIVIAAQDTSEDTEWEAIILEEAKGSDTQMVYSETFHSRTDCRDACEREFKGLYKGEKWLGFGG